jgi:hypothetical protein
VEYAEDEHGLGVWHIVQDIASADAAPNLELAQAGILLIDHAELRLLCDTFEHCL